MPQGDLLAEAKRLRLAHWKIQKDAGVDIIPSNDFALYDQVLHHIQDFGVSCCNLILAHTAMVNSVKADIALSRKGCP